MRSFGFRAGGAVGDLLGEVVALAEFLAHDLDDVLGVGVVLGEDEGLGHPGAAGEDFGEELVAEGADDGADLVRGDHVAVELVGVVAEVVVELFPALLAGVALLNLHRVAGLHLGAGLGDLGADAVDVVVDVDAVGHGHFVVVFHHQVLVEEAEGLLAGRGGEADEGGVEILQHLRPEVVDGAVAFVGDDDVEALDRDTGVVFDRLGVLNRPPSLSTDSSSRSSGSSLPFSIEYRRWMVQMQTRAVVSRVLLDRRWTMYSSVNLKLLYGEAYCWNSLSVWSPRLPRSTKNSTRRALANLRSL